MRKPVFCGDTVTIPDLGRGYIVLIFLKAGLFFRPCEYPNNAVSHVNEQELTGRRTGACRVPQLLADVWKT